MSIREETKKERLINLRVTEKMFRILSEMKINISDTCRKALEKEIDNYDPSVWCSACGAKSAKKCKCGPIAKND